MEKSCEVAEESPVNYMDVKIHGIYNVPPAWWTDGRPPAFPEHPFRYEVSFAIDEENTYTFTHGSLLQVLPQYEKYIENAAPPPLPSALETMLQNIREIPESPTLPTDMSFKGTGFNSKKTTDDVPMVEARIMWVLTPEADAVVQNTEEQSAKRRKKMLAASSTDDVPPPVVPTEDDVAPCVIRVPLYDRHVAALESKMISGEPLELQFSRVLKDGVPQDWEDTQECYFRAVIPVSLSSLTDPGSLQLTDMVPLVPVKPPTRSEEKGRKKSTKRPKLNVPGILVDEISTEAEHPYLKCGTEAKVSLQLEKSLARLASDRVRPLLTPSNLIPTRSPPAKEYRDSTWHFTGVVEGIAEKIMQNYKASKVENEGKTKEQFFSTFQTTGQLAAYKEELTPLVIKIVQEKFLRDPGASQKEINQFTNELYVYLLDCIHTTLRRMMGGFQKKNGKGNSSEVSLLGIQQSSSPSVSSFMWLERAEEAEALHEYEQAASCHQARISGCASPEDFPDLWADAGAFFVRVGDGARAEQCYREAIAYNPLHLPSLLGYGDLLLSYHRLEEAAVFLHAAVDVDPVPLTWGHIVLLCDLHVLSLEQGPEYESKRVRWEREGVLAMREALNVTEEVDFNDVTIEVSEYLLGLHHPDLANVTLSRCLPGGKTELLYAQMFTLCEQYENALEVMNNEELQAYQDEVAILRGKCNAALGRSEEAIRLYKKVLCCEKATPQRSFGQSYIHLGNLLISAGRYNDALGVFTLGIQAWPCSLMWLGAGITYYRLRKMDAAEECLSESNTLNNINPRTWAYLALVCLHKGHVEVELLLQQSISQGLSDPALLAELGRDLVRAGRSKLGEVCLQKAITLEREAGRAGSEVFCTSMYYLANALEGSRRLEAKELFTQVVQLSTNEVLRGKAEEQLRLLSN